MRLRFGAATAVAAMALGCGGGAAGSNPGGGPDAGEAPDRSDALEVGAAPDTSGDQATVDVATNEEDAAISEAALPEDAPTAEAAAPLDAAGADATAPAGDAGALAWSGLRNPILQVAGWATKDVAVVYEAGVYYFYYSAFFPEAGMERCHVAMSTSRDLKTFTAARVLFDAVAGGYGALCSPDVSRIGGQYVMRFDSWTGGTKPQGLYYSASSDLQNWGPVQPLAESLWNGIGGYDPTMAEANGRVYLLYISGGHPRVAVAPSIGGPWTVVGTPAMLMQSGQDNGLTHENFQLVAIDHAWYSMQTDYGPIAPYLYRMMGAGATDTDWLRWVGGYQLMVAHEAFNTSLVASAAYLADWRAQDGFFYLFYAGSTEHTSHAGRGNCTVAVSRSTDLKTWIPAGQ